MTNKQRKAKEKVRSIEGEEKNEPLLEGVHWKDLWEKARGRIQDSVLISIVELSDGSFHEIIEKEKGRQAFQAFLQKLQRGAYTAKDFHNGGNLFLLLVADLLGYLEELGGILPLLPTLFEAFKTKKATDWWVYADGAYVAFDRGYPSGHTFLLAVLHHHPHQEVLPLLRELLEEAKSAQKDFIGRLNRMVPSPKLWPIIDNIYGLKKEVLHVASKIPDPEANELLINQLGEYFEEEYFSGELDARETAVELIDTRPKTKRLVFAVRQVWHLRLKIDYKAYELLKKWDKLPERHDIDTINAIFMRNDNGVPEAKVVFSCLAKSNFSDKYYLNNELMINDLGSEPVEVAAYSSLAIPLPEVVAETVALIKNWLVYLNCPELANLYYSRIIYFLNSVTDFLNEFPQDQPAQSSSAKPESQPTTNDSGQKAGEEEGGPITPDSTIKRLMQEAAKRESSKELRALLERIIKHLK